MASTASVRFILGRRLAAAALVAAAGAAVAAQPPAAAEAWLRYQSALDGRLVSTPGVPFFVQDRAGGDPAWREAARAGQVRIVRLDTPPVGGGRIHHWIGGMYIPDTTAAALVARLQRDAGREAEFYDDVVESRVLGRNADEVRIFMKLRRTALITVTYDTEHTVQYRRLPDGRFAARSIATRIAELADAGTARERQLPPGEDRGFLWRLGAYWRYETWQGGVLVECESVSLSRAMPALLAPVAGPVVDRIARDSLDRTLRSLRDAATGRGRAADSWPVRRPAAGRYGTIRTSKSFGQSLPVTNSRSRAAS